MKNRWLWGGTRAVVSLAAVLGCSSSPEGGAEARLGSARSALVLTGGELVGRPTATSATVQVLAASAAEAYFEYGIAPSAYSGSTSATTFSSGTIEAVISGLTPDTRYYYRLRYRDAGSSDAFAAGAERTLHTQRARGATFTFAVQADSHQGFESFYSDALYGVLQDNIRRDAPDLLFDLGDTFSLDAASGGVSSETEATVRQKYLDQRNFFAISGHSSAVFLVLGNHENEEGWNLNDRGADVWNSLPVLGANARKRYFVNPVPNGFYTGNLDASTTEIDDDHLKENYYAFEWGDALFVAIDPFWYTMKKPFANGAAGGELNEPAAEIGTRWDWTLGIQQYLWLKQTLEGSTAKYKFVFAHHLVGGTADYSRGGALGAKYVEWGGYDTDGVTWGWDARRPAAQGWTKPIHQLFVDNGVTIFFHGHDHIFAKEELDGVVYQEVPHAANDDYGSGFASNLVDYAGAVRHNNSGHIRITVSPTAATVDYVRAYLPQDEGTNGRGFNRDVSYAYTVAPIGACDSALDCDDGDPCTTDSCVVPDGCVHAPVPVCVSPAARFETGTVTVGATPVAVELAQQYVSPVVVSSVRYRNNTLPVVTRVSSVTGGSFALRLQNPSGQAPQAETVDYLVMDEGAWDFDDLRCEAQRALSTRTDSDASWVAESRSYLRAYTSPVVLGQIMSENDARWSVFWSRGSSATNPPSASALYVGKHVGEDAVTTRANETLGIIVCESRRGRVGGVDFEVKLGADTVGGTADAPPYSYGFFPAFAAAPSVAVVSQSGMDGANGSWAELHGASALSASALALSVDEDQTSDTERNHTTEQVAYAVFAANVVYPNADACPADPSKTTPGVCGCGTPDTDSDSDGIPDCIDVNAPPVAVADSAQTESGGAVTIAVAQNDSDPDHNLVASTARPISMPSGGTATALGDGTIRYVAATGYAGTDAFTYEICDAQGACAMAAVTVLVTAPPDPGGAPLEFVTTTVSGTRSTVLFAQSYADPVVVCSSRYASNSLPVVVRVSNVLADRFDVRLQNPSNAAVSAEAVSCLVVERGPWTVDGVKLEAQKYLSTVTDRAALWTGQTQAYLQSYSQPVVLGQVMTENDAGFSAFWCRGNSRTNPPSPTALMTGKMVAEDTDTTRVNETVGFVVIEAGHGVLRGIEYEAALGADTILGVGDAPPYSYTFRTPFARSLAGAVVSMSAMDGTNGGWAQLHGSSALSATRMLLSIDEDQILDSERQHANEQVSYFAFSTP